MEDDTKDKEMWVIIRPEHMKMLDLCGRIRLPEVAEKLGITPNTLYNRIKRIRDRFVKGQKEYNQILNLMKKYPNVKKLMIPKTLKPTEKDLEPELYEDEEAEG